MATTRKRRSFLSRHPRTKRVAYTFYALLVVLLGLAVLPLRILPRRLTYWLGGIIGRTLVYPAVRPKIEMNLRHAYGTRMTPRRLRAIGLKVATNVTWSAIDCYYLWLWWCLFDVRSTVARVFNRAPLEHALAKKAGAIVVTAHYQCFDIIAVYGHTMTDTGGVIARSFPSPLINWLFRRARMLHGIPTFFDEIKGAIKALRGNGIVGILPDLHARKRLAVPARFFGKPTLTFDIHVRIAGQTRSPLIPAFLLRHRRTPWLYSMVFYDAIIVPAKPSADTILSCVQSVNDAIEHHIRRFPSGWIWFHNKWALW